MADNKLINLFDDLYGSPEVTTNAKGTNNKQTNAPWVEKYLANRAAAGEPVPAKQEAAAVQEEETDPMEELDALIGLQSIKHDVKELIAYAKVQKMREENGLKTAPVSLHLVFTGNPGTGKTTVARIMAKLYRQIGVLSKGQQIGRAHV